MSDKTNDRWKGIERPLQSRPTWQRLRGSVHIEYSLARLGAEKFWRQLHSEPVIAGLGCMTGNQAIQTVQAGLEGHLLLGLAGGRRCQHRRRGVPGPEPVSRRLGAENGRAHQQRAAAHRPNSSHGRQNRHRLAGAHHRRCGSRLRRQPQCLRTDQGIDPRRRRRRALRRSAVVRQEMRALGRQGAGVHRRGHQQAGGRAPRGRRHGRAHGDHRPHRCRCGGPAADRS